MTKTYDIRGRLIPEKPRFKTKGNLVILAKKPKAAVIIQVGSVYDLPKPSRTRKRMWNVLMFER